MVTGDRIRAGSDHSKDACAMPIVSSLFIPHAPAIFDGGDGCSAVAAERKQALTESLKEDFCTAFRGTREAAEIAKTTRPDVIFLLTQHGISLWSSFSVYLAPRAKGNAEWSGNWTEYDVDVALDVDLAKAFLQRLQGDNIPADGIVTFDVVWEAPLRWGEVVPLWFLRDLTSAGVKVVIFSCPNSKLTDRDPLSDCPKVGASIAKFLNKLPQRVLFIAGGELSHGHKTDCAVPLYLPDPRWTLPASPDALLLDLSLVHWALCSPIASEEVTQSVNIAKEHSAKWDKSTYKVAQQWLAKASKLKDSASLYSCGFYGIGVLNAMLVAEVEAGACYDARVLCRVAPTYFGMMSAAFIKKDP